MCHNSNTLSDILMKFVRIDQTGDGEGVLYTRTTSCYNSNKLGDILVILSRIVHKFEKVSHIQELQLWMPQFLS